MAGRHHGLPSTGHANTMALVRGMNYFLVEGPNSAGAATVFPHSLTLS